MLDVAYLKQALNELLATPSPVGMTDRAMLVVERHLAQMGIACSRTNRGMLSAVVGTAPARRAIAVHVDTLGAMVSELKSNGRLALRNTGTWAARFAEGARVTVFSDGGTFRGSILPLKASGHRFNTEVDSQPGDWDNLEIRVDAEVASEVDLAKLGFNVGDMVAIDPQTEWVGDHVISRHLDNKAGCAVLLSVLKALSETGTVPEIGCQVLFSSSEETGIGATHGIGAEVEEFLAVDNGVSGPNQTTNDKAVTIAMRDRQGPFDMPVTRHLIDLAQSNGIKHVRDTFRHYRSDSAAAVEAGYDVRVGLVCFALDSSHGWERTHLASLVELGKLLRFYIVSGLGTGR